MLHWTHADSAELAADSNWHRDVLVLRQSVRQSILLYIAARPAIAERPVELGVIDVMQATGSLDYSIYRKCRWSLPDGYALWATLSRRESLE